MTRNRDDEIGRLERITIAMEHLVADDFVTISDLDDTLVSIKSAEDFQWVCGVFVESWGYGSVFDVEKLVKKSSMKDGRTNYVFRVKWL